MDSGHLAKADKVSRQAAHFDRIAETYRVSRQHRNHLTLKNLIWDEFLADKNDLRRGPLEVLEPMCGFADGREILAAHLGVELDYRGFDYSGEVVKTLRQSRPDIAVTHQDATRFEADRLYDVIILIGGLHHIPDAAAPTVGRLARAMKPGGYFISFEPTDGNPVFSQVRRWIYRRNQLFDEQTERTFPLSEYFGMFESAGLRRIDCLYPGLLAYVLFYNPDAFPFLNVGGPGLVRAIWALERPFMRSALGRTLSFASLALWQRPGIAQARL